MWSGSPDPLTFRGFDKIQHQTALQINGSGDPLHSEPGPRYNTPFVDGK